MSGPTTHSHAWHCPLLVGMGGSSTRGIKNRIHIYPYHRLPLHSLSIPSSSWEKSRRKRATLYISHDRWMPRISKVTLDYPLRLSIQLLLYTVNLRRFYWALLQDEWPLRELWNVCVIGNNRSVLHSWYCWRLETCIRLRGNMKTPPRLDENYCRQVNR